MQHNLVQGVYVVHTIPCETGDGWMMILPGSIHSIWLLIFIIEVPLSKRQSRITIASFASPGRTYRDRPRLREPRWELKTSTTPSRFPGPLWTHISLVLGTRRYGAAPTKPTPRGIPRGIYKYVRTSMYGRRWSFRQGFRDAFGLRRRQPRPMFPYTSTHPSERERVHPRDVGDRPRGFVQSAG
ncbi:hypothetical protein BJX61DRAFT_526096 [Aspergillus egyptiacus]|nr:hypothetical protein BJX61DRAFT_526096 [Aspergillus egyptiacus]